MRKLAMTGAVITGFGLTACGKAPEDYQNRANQILNGYLGENIQTGDMAYREGTPIPNKDNACGTIQPIFDPTTGEPIAIIDSRIVRKAEQNGDEIVVLCDESSSGTDAGLDLEGTIPTS